MPESWTPKRVFELYDKDNSGSLDISELEFALTSTLGVLVPPKEVEKVSQIKYDLASVKPQIQPISNPNSNFAQYS